VDICGPGKEPAMTSVWWATVTALVGVLVGASAATLTLRRRGSRLRAELTALELTVQGRADQVNALSHELRTPLSMIKGAVDLLREGTPGPLTTAQEKFLQVVDHQSTQVISLCESLLLQAKIEAGLFTLRPERTDVAVIVRDVVAAMRPLCEQRGQRITLDTPQVMPRILADPMLLTQAMTNLLSNAGRFTTAGGSIDVRVMVVDSGVAVYVTDDGAGMSRAERARLFQRFATGRPLVDGTGLGLVITKIIIELHGGEILVHTASTRGTTFLLTLPGRP
jgi:signal transduction histidine kinase